MIRIVTYIQKKLVWALPVTMAAGYLYGISFNAGILKAAIVPLTILMVFPMMVTLQVKTLFTGKDLSVVGVAQAVNFLVIPFIAFFIGKTFFHAEYNLILGLLLTGLLPTSGMTISWTGMAKGNMAAAVKMTVTGLLLGSFATPLYVKILLGTVVDVPLAAIVRQIAVIVVMPLLFGMATRRVLEKMYGQERFERSLKKNFPPFATLGVVGIVFVAIALKARHIAAHPQMLLMIMVPLVLLYGVNIMVSILTGKLMFNRNDAVALLYGTVMRNLSIALGIAMTAFGKRGEDVALVVAMGYIIQVQLGAWLNRLVTPVFGNANVPQASISKSTEVAAG